LVGCFWLGFLGGIVWSLFLGVAKQVFLGIKVELFGVVWSFAGGYGRVVL